ncbi:MAG TPA: DNA cytosine methyltransferase [Acidimicrobiales bacterium]|nr:DNA cytosine methyltransferase [Acidimicrobiales bacterium]
MINWHFLYLRLNGICALDLFAGAGGFSLGAHRVAGEVLGIELDADAVATQRAAGMTCEQADVTTLDPQDYDPRREVAGAHFHLHASPPCQTFSNAGKGEGRKHLETLSRAVAYILQYGNADLIDLSEVPEGSLLVLEPARWIHETRPDTISLEQVRSVLPVWEAYAHWLPYLGYHVWTGLLHSEQYGVPQTRTRAWLGASLNQPVEPPAPTHSRYHVRKPERLDAGVSPWVSMAEALGWGSRDLVGFPRRADNDDTVHLDGVDYRARDLREGDQPSFGLTEKARSWTHWRQGAQERATTRAVDHPSGTIAFGNDMAQMRFTFDDSDVGYQTEAFGYLMQGGVSGEGKPRPSTEPAPTMSAKGTASVTDDPDDHYGRDRRKANDAGEDWSHLRPSTTVQGDPRIWPPGHKVNQTDRDRHADADERYGDRAGKKARRVTIEEAGVLQGFPARFPWQGTKTSQFRQCGNAVNPQVAEAVLWSVLKP